jgi:DNA-binding XRE family transcriptional regulator
MPRQYTRKPLAERFWSHVDTTGDCWLWTGHRNAQGYGQITLEKGKYARSNRLAYELAYGTIPDGMLVRHSCDQPACCRPEHLVLGDNQANMDDMTARDRQAKGESASRAKLTAESVQDIRSRHAAGTVTQRALAREYGVSKHAIYSILTRKTWRHL